MGLFSEAYWKGTGVHRGFMGWPTMESKVADRTVAHLSCKREQPELLEQLEQQEQQDTQVQQDTQSDNRIHGWTTRYMAGLQDTQPDNRIHSWTTGYTAVQQDSWPDFGIHSQTTGYVETPQKQQSKSSRDKRQA